METPTGWRLGHRSGLDGLRGIAILIVLIGHTLPYGITYPPAGVSLFFVLSGFLITSLLLEELEDHGRINVRGFYTRRIRRLLPAFAVVAVVTLVSMVAIGQAASGLFDTVVAASYVGNWVMATGQLLGPLTHTWSLAIEEQFYAIWPLIFLVIVPRVTRRKLTFALAFLAVLVIVARALAVIAGLSGARIAFATDMQADGLLVACALAVLIHRRPIRMPRITTPVALGVIVASAFLLPIGVVLALGQAPDYPLIPALGSTIAVLASGALVLSVASAENSDPLFENRWLIRLGLISYGLYLWHYPILWHLGFFDGNPWPGMAAVAVGIGLSLLAAACSYRWVEMPLRKRRPDRSARRDVQLQPAEEAGVL